MDETRTEERAGATHIHFSAPTWAWGAVFTIHTAEPGSFSINYGGAALRSFILRFVPGLGTSIMPRSEALR